MCVRTMQKIFTTSQTTQKKEKIMGILGSFTDGDTSIKVAKSGKGFDIEWKQVKNATSYKVERFVEK